MKSSGKIKFLLKNLLRGLIWLSVLVAAFIIVKRNSNYVEWLSLVYEHPIWVYVIYSLSELLFGIIPPEIFMIWGLRAGEEVEYVLIVFSLAVISYLAGVAGFSFGSYLNHTYLFSRLKHKFLGKYEKYFMRFGSFLIIVAAVTPIPFSGISMLVGSVHFPFKKYLLSALARFLRFAAYSFIIWKANMI